jgi:tetratricopeptide (TPR) repeat protein
MTVPCPVVRESTSVVRWPSTVGVWLRRERLLASVLAAATAIVALSGPIGVRWLLFVGLSVAAVAALARVVIAVGQSNAERDREAAELGHRVRVPFKGVNDVDPREVGVDPAAQEILPGGDTPEYVPRVADEEIRRAIDRAIEDEDRWIVVVCGPAKVGKSRTLFEALRACAHHHDLCLVAPADGEGLRSLLTPPPKPRMSGMRPILWLDDLEPFVAQGITLDTLRLWHEATGMPVLATYGGKGSERIGESAGMRELTELTRTLLQHAREIDLGMTSRLEVEKLTSPIAPEVRSAIGLHGLAAYLVAAPELRRKLTTRRHGPGEPQSPEGAAIVYAAADWALCGRTDPMPKRALQQLWPAYVATADPSFEDALRWALRPVAGDIALLRQTRGYLAYDYIVGFVRDRPDAVDPLDEAWECATDTEDPGQAFAVGVSAWAYDRSDYAIRAFSKARDEANPDIAGIASFNLGLAYRRLRNTGAAREAYEWAIRSGHPDAAPTAAAALGVLLQQQGDLRNAEQAFQQAIDSGHPDARPRAAVSLGVLLELEGQTDRAREAYQCAIDSGHSAAASAALLQIAALLERDGDLEEARAGYREALATGHNETVRAAREALRHLDRDQVVMKRPERPGGKTPADTDSGV